MVLKMKMFREITTSALQGVWRQRKAHRAALAGRPAGEFRETTRGHIEFTRSTGVNVSKGQRPEMLPGAVGTQNILGNYRVTDPAADLLHLQRMGFDGPGLIPAIRGNSHDSLPQQDLNLHPCVSIHAAVDLVTAYEGRQKGSALADEAPGEVLTRAAAQGGGLLRGLK